MAFKSIYKDIENKRPVAKVIHRNNLKPMKQTISLSLSLLALFLLISLSSCNEDEEQPDPRPALLEKNWIISTLHLKITYGVLGKTIDGYAEMPDCAKDDLFVFQENGDLQILQNTNKCDPASSDIIATGSWSLDGTNLTVTTGYFSGLIDQIAASAPIAFEYDNDSFIFDLHDIVSGVIRLNHAEVYVEPSSQTEYQIEVNSEFEAVEK